MGARACLKAQQPCEQHVPLCSHQTNAELHPAPLQRPLQERDGFHFESGPSLYSDMDSRGKAANPLAHVLQVRAARKCRGAGGAAKLLAPSNRCCHVRMGLLAPALASPRLCFHSCKQSAPSR
jgi:hypothetical protein